MTKTFQDRNFLVWEVYSSAGRHVYSKGPQLIFHCLTQRDIRPRYVDAGTNEADAQKLVAEASSAELLEMLERAQEIA
jgi:hypothetical protein